MVISWLCTAMACDGASHTEQQLMYWGILVWPMGIMGMGGSGGEPVGLIIVPGIVAHLIDVAVDEGHGAEVEQAGASKPWKEIM